MHILEQAKKYLHGEEVIRDWLGSGGVTVNQELAQSRANVCIGCSKNEPGFVPVEKVAAAIKRLLEIKSHLRLRVQGDRSLHTCNACLCPTRTKIWVPLDVILKSEDEESLSKYDKRCWILTESRERVT